MALSPALIQWFASAGVVPPARRAADVLATANDFAACVSALLDSWRDLLDRGPSARTARRAEDCTGLLKLWQSQRSECWTAGDPRIPPRVSDWLGPREWWWSRPSPLGVRMAIVSSRLPRLRGPQDTWLRALRAALNRAAEQSAVLIAGYNTAGSEFVLRGAVRQGSAAVRVRCSGDQVRLSRHWARQWSLQWRDDPDSGPVDVWALPDDLDVDTAGPELDTEILSLPANDRAAIAWADEVLVLRLRPGGNLHLLVRHRLRRPNAHVLLVDLPGLQTARTCEELLDAGAILWTPPHCVAQAGAGWRWTADPDEPSGSRGANGPARESGDGPNDPPPVTLRVTSGPPRRTHGRASVVGLVRIPPAATWDFLTHTTRACVGPWPDQSRDDFIDSLLDGRPDADHSPLAALVRIVTQRRLIASSLAIRGRYRIVSFTAVPLAELPRLRVFRSHRSRWDFEPYGICIRREWLERRGAQPVRYGGEPDWQRMAEPDRPFFQLVRRVDRGEFGRRHTPEQLADQTAGRPFTPTISPGEARESGLATGDAAGNAERVAIDWTVEHEWRHLGDLDLSALGRDEALLFVPDEEKARLLLEFSPWPVTVYRL